MGRANAHRVLGRVDKAAQLSKHAMRLLPADPSAWLCGALAHQSKGDTKTAMRLATAILSKNPTVLEPNTVQGLTWRTAKSPLLVRLFFPWPTLIGL